MINHQLQHFAAIHLCSKDAAFFGWFKHILFITGHDKGSGRPKTYAQPSP